MFLNQLTEKEKNAFSSLFIHLAESDEDYSSEEFELFQDVCKEMRISYFDFDYVMPIENIIDIFRNSSEKSKKIAVYEAMDIIAADGKLEPEEITALDHFAKNIGIDDDTLAILVKKFNEINATECKVNDLIFEE